MTHIASSAAADAETSIDVVARPCCLLCGAQGREIYSGMIDWLFGSTGSWGMRKCPACDIAWLDPQPLDSQIPKLYARYYTHSGSRATTFQTLRHATLQCVLARMGYNVVPPTAMLPRLLARVPPISRAAALDVMDLAPGDGKLLDVGCGSGEFIGRMRSLGWNVAGVDPDLAAVRGARAAGLEIYHGTVADVPESGIYDVITLNHVIEHVVDPIALLRECCKRLCPRDGTLLITTPNIKSLGHRWFKSYWRGLEVPRHLAVFSPSALSECVARAGLRVRSIRTETRLARMIFAPSVCAKAGEQNIGERNDFSRRTKCAAYAFQLLEDGFFYLNKGIGEEIFCICAPRKENDPRE